MKVVWTPEAEQDRRDIVNYIAVDNPLAAVKMDELFDLAVNRLMKRAYIGRPGKIPGTRELIPHESYRLVYEIEGDVIWILALVHTSRQWPPVWD